MPAYTKPFGLQPVNLIGGIPFAGSTREYTISSAFGTALRPGDIVGVASGVITKETGTTSFTSGGVIGVFVGCAFTDATFGRTFRTNWTASQAGTDPVAVVTDDPNTIFRAAYVSSGVTMSAQTAAAVIGKNMSVVQNTTSTKNSDVAVSGVATTNTLPMRCVDVDRDSVNAAGTFTAVLVKWNHTFHAYNNILGT